MMDKYSFLNAAHTAFFSDLYEQYLTHPDSVEPSWRAFFQGFDFGVESTLGELDVDAGQGVVRTAAGEVAPMPESMHKEFRVVRLIDGYRSRGHLFTRTNPVRERRKYSPTLDIENFGLAASDLGTVFNAGEIIGIGPATLSKIIDHLKRIYCDAIGVEYMYIRIPEQPPEL